ncbi:hypothetical protein F53441_10249 [Fusarium austroafricanum]|uniref:Ubiquitin-like protease family profile domain-containing protein n=1 Tax=Fusarium austroafricanum TaxID=2364996 RepID=A0A8H4KB49_9HYPO|nr:hypothetical protein F53441_10249 [Fusarium austroafricanum]
MGAGKSSETKGHHDEPRDDQSNKRIKQYGSGSSRASISHLLAQTPRSRPAESIEDDAQPILQHKRVPVHDLTGEGSMAETIDGSSVISNGRNAGATSNQQEYRNVHRQNSVKASRRRRRNQPKISSSPIQIDDDTSAVAHRNLPPQSTHASTSPDHLAIDINHHDGPPPSNITSDLVPQSKRPAQEYSQSAPKRFKVHSKSDDELAHGTPQKKPSAPKLFSQQRSQRGDIQHTAFKTAKTIAGRDDPTTRGPMPSVLSLDSAVCGAYLYSLAQTPQIEVTLHLDSDTASPTHSGGKDLPWLYIWKSTISVASHDNSHSPIVSMKRSMRPGTPSGHLVLKFTHDDHATIFIQWLHGVPCLREMPSHELERTLNYALGEAQTHSKNPMQRSGSVSPNDTHITNTLRARSRASHRDPFVSERRTPEPQTPKPIKLKDRMQGASRPKEDVHMELAGTEDSYTGLNRSQGFETRRLTRSSPQTRRERTPEPWTARNPGWDKDWHRSLVYPLTGKNRATVDKDDIQRLDEGEFLNDNLISFYLRYLQDQLEKEGSDILQKVHIFSTFFFEKLRSNRAKINYDGVKAWTARINLLSYKYIVVPVNENAHWYLAIIYNAPRLLPQKMKAEALPKESSNPREAIVVEDNGPEMSLSEKSVPERNPSIMSVDIEVTRSTRSRCANDSSISLLDDESMTSAGATANSTRRKSTGGNQKFSTDEPRIITLDSLGSAHSPTCKCLKDYLIEEARDKNRVEITDLPGGMTARGIPMQNNYCDCGVYVLGYMEHFLKDPDEAVRRLLHKEDTKWDIDAPKIRAKVRDLLFKFQKEQQLRLEHEKEMKRQRRATRGPVSSPQVAPSSPQVPQREPETPQVKRNPKSPLANGTSRTPIEEPRRTETTSAYFATALLGKPEQPQTPVRNETPSFVQPLREDSSNESKASSSADVYHSACSSPVNSAPQIPPSLTSEGYGLHSDQVSKKPSTPEFVQRLPDSPGKVGSSTVKKTSSPVMALVTRQRPSPTAAQSSRHVIELDQSVMKSIEDDKPSPKGPQYDGVDQSIDLTV